MAEVVDREHGPRSVEEPVPAIHRLQMEREEGRMPVVAVKDVRRPAEPTASLQRRSREQDEAPVLVRILRVDRWPLVEGRAVDQVELRVRIRERGAPECER